MKRSFADILRQFEKSQIKNKKSIHDAILNHIDKHGVLDKDNEIESSLKKERISYKKIVSDDSLDLHGATGKEALEKLQIFFDNAVKNKYKQLSIIHGKGKHSKTQAVLYGVVRKFLEENKYAGRMGFEKNDKGGSGSTWVMLKYNE